MVVLEAHLGSFLVEIFSAFLLFVELFGSWLLQKKLCRKALDFMRFQLMRHVRHTHKVLQFSVFAKI
jgi:hypothetical protein